jgi:hypothetical protein
MSWDPIVATLKSSCPIWRPIWSPCSRFIAVEPLEPGTGIQLLDAVTLNQVKIFIPPQDDDYTQLVIISTQSHLLTWLGVESDVFVSWDIQTGVLVSEIPIAESRPAGVASSITYSQCGTMFGVLFKHDNTATIGTYNVLSSTLISYHPIKRMVMGTTWTHGKCLQFTTFGLRSMTIWEVGFASKHSATAVESLPTPDNFDPREEFLFLPTLSRLAFILEETVLVWDARYSKFLLNSVNVTQPKNTTFSPDGCFFACGTHGPEIYLWKESSIGYLLHQKLVSSGASTNVLLSHNGRSIIACNETTLWLWHTMDSNTTTSTPSTLLTSSFILGFSPDESLAAVARSTSGTAIVLNLTSGLPQLIINADMRIWGLRVTESTIIVIGDGKVVTWDLPAGDGVLNARASIYDSVQTTVFDHSAFLESKIHLASISPDSNHIAVVRTLQDPKLAYLLIYDATTGKKLVQTPSRGHTLHPPWFTPDGCEVWCSQIRGWAITKDSGSDLLKLEPLGPTRYQPERCPWEPSHGYKITDDGWVLSSSGKQLLWLPPHWQSYKTNREWSGQFLALLHHELPEAVILELLEE